MYRSQAPESKVENHFLQQFIIVTYFREVEGVGRRGTSAIRRNCRLCIIEHSLPGI